MPYPGADKKEDWEFRMTQDVDIYETQEWLDSLHATIRHAGPERAAFLLKALFDNAMAKGVENKTISSCSDSCGDINRSYTSHSSGNNNLSRG